MVREAALRLGLLASPRKIASGRLYYFGARYYDPRTSVWQSADPILAKYLPTGNKEKDKNLAGMGGVFNSGNLAMYSYVHLNPVRYVDPDGNEISAQDHEVLGSGDFHVSIRITPENQAAYANDKNFTRKDEKGKRYATIGAGPTLLIWGNLKGDINRTKDVDLSIKVENVKVDIGKRNEDQVIGQLVAADKHYKDDLTYDLHPTKNGSGYNSNSYASGLLNAVGLEAPKLKSNTPGYDKPVPSDNFRAGASGSWKPENATGSW